MGKTAALVAAVLRRGLIRFAQVILTAVSALALALALGVLLLIGLDALLAVFGLSAR